MSLKTLQEQVWARRNISAAESYYNLLSHTSRSKYISKFLLNKDISSIFEVGLMGGRNVDIIRNEHSMSNYGGIDICKAGVEYAQQKKCQRGTSGMSINFISTNKPPRIRKYGFDRFDKDFKNKIPKPPIHLSGALMKSNLYRDMGGMEVFKYSSDSIFAIKVNYYLVLTGKLKL